MTTTRLARAITLLTAGVVLFLVAGPVANSAARSDADARGSGVAVTRTHTATVAEAILDTGWRSKVAGHHVSMVAGTAGLVALTALAVWMLGRPRHTGRACRPRPAPRLRGPPLLLRSV